MCLRASNWQTSEHKKGHFERGCLPAWTSHGCIRPRTEVSVKVGQRQGALNCATRGRLQSGWTARIYRLLRLSLDLIHWLVDALFAKMR